LGEKWFSDAYRPAGWAADQGRPYYLTESALILLAVLIAGVFWFVGRRNLRTAQAVGHAEDLNADEVQTDIDSDLNQETEEESASNN
jgi:hypothetical protein